MYWIPVIVAIALAVGCYFLVKLILDEPTLSEWYGNELERRIKKRESKSFR